jgi:hypothetical protein
MREVPMAGRPKREEEVTPVLLRMTPALLKRVERCQTRLALQEDARLTRTEAFWRIIEAGCEALEEPREGRETPVLAQTPLSEISAISPILISKISEISGEDISVPGYGFPEDREDEEIPTPLRNGALQKPRVSSEPRLLDVEPQPVAETEQGGMPAPAAPVVQTAPAIRTRAIPQHIQVIADARAEYEKLSLAAFSHLLYDRGIYRSRDRQSGEEKPVNRGTLQKWLGEAREAGLL